VDSGLWFSAGPARCRTRISGTIWRTGNVAGVSVDAVALWRRGPRQQGSAGHASGRPQLLQRRTGRIDSAHGTPGSFGGFRTRPSLSGRSAALSSTSPPFRFRVPSDHLAQRHDLVATKLVTIFRIARRTGWATADRRPHTVEMARFEADVSLVGVPHERGGNQGLVGGSAVKHPPTRRCSGLFASTCMSGAGNARPARSSPTRTRTGPRARSRRGAGAVPAVRFPTIRWVRRGPPHHLGQQPGTRPRPCVGSWPALCVRAGSDQWRLLALRQ
jgi:hypothetical protein